MSVWKNLPVLLKLLIKPDRYWYQFLNSRLTGRQVFFSYAPTFALIGPVLSLYSLTSQEGYSYFRAGFYSVLTYILDLAVVLVFPLFLSKVSKLNYDLLLKFYLAVNIPVFSGFGTACWSLPAECSNR